MAKCDHSALMQLIGSTLEQNVGLAENKWYDCPACSERCTVAAYRDPTHGAVAQIRSYGGPEGDSFSVWHYIDDGWRMVRSG